MIPKSYVNHRQLAFATVLQRECCIIVVISNRNRVFVFQFNFTAEIIPFTPTKMAHK